MNDLFSQQRKEKLLQAQGLAVRMRPTTLAQFLGQEHFLGPGKMLRRMIEADRLTSVIFYGPPGTGKTTLARVIANATSAAFHQLNASAVGVREIRGVLDTARKSLEDAGQRTVLFIDELHRFNRAQQDVLLNDVEDGIVILIGATTENPFFAVNAPLVSRSQIFRFEPLSGADIKLLLQRALEDKDRGLGKYSVKITDQALDHLAKMSDGDARRALTALEIGVLSGLKHVKSGGAVDFTIEVAAESIQRKALDYDPTGDAHYDIISALIKSMRGSDPDAVVYWLARMLQAGEDIRFIARRIVICAAEDVGNADPMALILANAAVQVTEFVGMPEAQLPLAQAAIYIACAPKSNASAMAIWQAMDDVKNQRTIPVPVHLRDASYGGAKRLGHGKDYIYAHNEPGGVAGQEYLGVDKQYYHPTNRGREVQIGKYIEQFKALREKSRKQQKGPADES